MFKDLFTVYAGKQTADFATFAQCKKYVRELRKAGNTDRLTIIDPDGCRTDFIKNIKK